MSSNTPQSMASNTSPPQLNPISQDGASEPFPDLTNAPSPKSGGQSGTHQNVEYERSRGGSNSSTFQNRLRSASKNFEESSVPAGFMIASSQIATSIPSLADIRRGSFGSDGWSGEGQVREKERRASLTRRRSSQNSDDFVRQRTSSNPQSPATQASNQALRHQSLPEGPEEGEEERLDVITSGVPMGMQQSQKALPPYTTTSVEMGDVKDKKRVSDRGSSEDNDITPSASGKENTKYKTDPFDNGYQFPPKQKWTEATAIGLVAFWKFFITPVGFLVVIYGLNIVAWGGMLFLLLCNASPAMCTPTCNDINSPRRVWIEIDSQILNALFCVTGFGLIPWRFRDLYYLMQYRLQKKEIGLRRLAGINRGWFRLAGSQDLPIELGPGDIETGFANVSESSIPFPITKIADAPLTGVRAPPTKMWKLDFVIWTMVWNTFLQAVLCGFMWGMNRYSRPSWSTGLFVALACIVAALGGIMNFVEGKHVKAIEGVPVTEKEKEILRRDREMGVTHYNNIKDEKPKEKKQEKSLFRRKGRSEAVQINENTIEGGVRR